MQDETFVFLFQKLKVLYNFNPSIIACDFEFLLMKGIKTIYPNIKIFWCYYHFICAAKKNYFKLYNKGR